MVREAPENTQHFVRCILGVKAIIAKSVERIHAANLVNFGIISLSFKNMADYDKIEQGDEIEIPEIKKKLQNNEPVILVDKTKNLNIELTYNLSQTPKRHTLRGRTALLHSQIEAKGRKNVIKLA